MKITSKLYDPFSKYDKMAKTYKTFQNKKNKVEFTTIKQQK